jgi:hypothetical protein
VNEVLDTIVRIACESLEGSAEGCSRSGYSEADAHEALYIIHGLARGDSTPEQAIGYWNDWLSK